MDGREAAFTFEKPGTYEVSCEIEYAAGLMDTDILFVKVRIREVDEGSSNMLIVLLAVIVVAVVVGVLYRRYQSQEC